MAGCRWLGEWADRTLVEREQDSRGPEYGTGDR
jgi:hypothetical protein